MKIDNKGEISILTLIQVFILMIITVFLVNSGVPIMNALFFQNPAYAPGTFARLLMDLFPLAPVLGMFYLLFRQGPSGGF